MQHNKPGLIVVDRHATHREHVAAKLAPLYAVKGFAAMSETLRHARLNLPDAMLIAEERIRGENFSLLKSMRLEPAFATLPVIVLLAEDNPEQAAIALGAGATACLAMRCRVSALAATISSAVGRAVEKRWEVLPELEAAALKCSVAIFRAAAGQIAAGKPITYAEVSTACAPLLAAANSWNIKNILRCVREHDDYTYSHSLRVAVFLSVFGGSIGLSAEDRGVLAIGGLLHDLGKTVIPALLLNKPGRLTEEEFNLMREHVPATLKILERCTGIPRAALIIAGQHHEKLDGSGYPNGLPSARLNELARMAGIADVFTALTDRRVYKMALAPERAFDLMRAEMQHHLDQGLLERFRQMLLDMQLN